MWLFLLYLFPVVSSLFHSVVAVSHALQSGARPVGLNAACRFYGHSRGPILMRRVHARAQTNGPGDSLCIVPAIPAREMLQGTPTFINAAKFAMTTDDKALVKYLIQNYRKVHTVDDDEWQMYMAQLPALAAQFGAKHVWDSLDLDPEDPAVQMALKRSKTRHGMFINETDFSSQGEPVITYQYTLGWLLGTLQNFLSVSDTLSNNNIRPESFLATFGPVRQTNGPSWLDSFGKLFSKKQGTTEPPTVIDIAKALEIKDIRKRHHRINELRTLIKQVLSEGLYIMDDMIGTSNFMFLLWWRYSNDKDHVIQDFITELLKKGAPLSAENVMRDHKQFKGMSEDYKEVDMPLYFQMAKMAVRYTAGSAELSLGHALTTQSHSKRRLMSHIVEGYLATFPNLNIASSMVVKALQYYRSTPGADNAVIDMLAEHGRQRD